MFETLVDKVKAHIDEKKVEENIIVLRGWTFSEEYGVCPLRCKYDGTIRGVDIELRKDVCDLFGKSNIVLSGWKIRVPTHKYIDFQIKLGNEWFTFLSYHSSPAPAPEPAPAPALAPALASDPRPAPTASLTNNMTTVSFAVQPSSTSHVYVVDNFYERPDEVRSFGLQTSEQSSSADIVKSVQSLQDRMEQILGRKIASFSQFEENGRFTATNRFATIDYQTKPYQYAGYVFLTPNAPVTSGMTMYRSRTTKQPFLKEDVIRSNSTDLEAIDIIGNVYNRLVLFESQRVHAVTHHFGNDLERGRLVQTFAFNLA
jgi:hypothetical protein